MFEIKNRKDILEFILYIENHFSVNQWKYNDIYIWPYLRIELFNYLIKKSEYKAELLLNENIPIRSRSAGRKSILNRFVNLLHNLLFSVKYLLWVRDLEKRDFLFVGSEAHRVRHKNLSYNRFFDTLIDKYNIQSRSSFLEYGPETDELKANANISINYNTGLIYFRAFYAVKKRIGLTKNQNKKNLEGYNDFLSFLSSSENTTQFSETYSIKELRNLFFQIDFYSEFHNDILKKIKPLRLFILCYYGLDIMILTATANKLGIYTYEMQHGPQTLIHLAYGNWSKVPEGGYEMLPRNYWCWDEFSKNAIDSWTLKNGLYLSFIGGHPWLEYWKEKEHNYKNSQIILYTLQPMPLTIKDLFPDKLLSFIKNYKYKWYLRLHPRQLDNMDQIKAFLKEADVLPLVTIDVATNDPLPQLLKNSLLHVTNFSGTILESYFFNIYTVLIHPIGEDSFKEIIKEGKAMYIDPKSYDFELKLKGVLDEIEKRERRITNSTVDLFDTGSLFK
jgi:hypothetical protein